MDADYKIIWADVGTPGASGDAAVFNNSDLKDAVESEDLNLPEPEPLPGDNEDISHFFIANDAFALKTWLMKPFAKRNLTREVLIFNYRLSRAWRVVENALVYWLTASKSSSTLWDSSHIPSEPFASYAYVFIMWYDSGTNDFKTKL